MRFTAAAEHYDRFMGRYALPLATVFADAAGVTGGLRVLDVGCGPGGLTAELIARGAQVAAVDPASQFVAACLQRNPGADVREAPAEDLPFQDGAFDAALAQLVIAFMRDADRGLAEMARVTRPGGTVAACMWDTAGGGMTMLATFWRAVRTVDPGAGGEHRLPGTAEGDLVERFERAGLAEVTGGTLTARVDYTDFGDFWEPFTHGVGPAGQHLATLDAERQAAVREACRAELPEGAFSLDARAWFARGTA
jgi:ubiquinone/menaquinone biosynthesis C-methylase UbiE